MSATLDDVSKMYLKDDMADVNDLMTFLPKFVNQLTISFEDLFDSYGDIISNIERRNLTVDSIILTSSFAYNGMFLGHVYKCPIILFSPIGYASHWTQYLGNYDNPSHQVETSMSFVEPMTFMQRVINSLVYYYKNQYPWDERFVYPVFERKGGLSYNDVKSVYSNISLILQCSHFVTHNAQALLPNVVDIGGIHCRPGRALSDDWNEFMNSHPEGVVYVSFGSALRPSEMSEKRRQAFLDAFKKLRFQVIWKWDGDDIIDLPSNVKLTKWAPQQDLLAHPNLKVMVTHGGLLSLQEALYHKTPLIGIPFGNDQIINILRAKNRGYAIMLDWSNLTSNHLYEAINRAISDRGVQNAITKMNELFLDQSESPVDRAVWWVQYIMRHDGASFLRPKSLELSWYQYSLIDVAIFIALLLFVIIVISINCIYKLKKTFFGPATKTKVQ